MTQLVIFTLKELTKTDAKVAKPGEKENELKKIDETVTKPDEKVDLSSINKKIAFVAKTIINAIVSASLRVGINFLCLKYIPFIGFPLAVFTSFCQAADLSYKVTKIAFEALKPPNS